MNTAQQEVLDKVIELLSEHFDHAIVAVGCYDEDKQYSTTATYSGITFDSNAGSFTVNGTTAISLNNRMAMAHQF